MRRLRPNHPRVLFAAELRAFNAARAEQATLGAKHPIAIAYKEALYRNARAAGHSRSKCDRAMEGDYGEASFKRMLGDEAFAEITEHFKAQSDELWDAISDRVNKSETEMQRLAKLTDPMPGAERVRWSSTWPHSYASTTQGNHYARTMAEIGAEELNTWLGLKANVVEVHVDTTLVTGQWLPKRVASYDVYVMVQAPLDVEIARRSLKRMPMGEAVRLAWAKGADARVYWPTLPWGFEEAHGFDFFGAPLAGRAR